ncbi:uncharacterized protein [Panulirus ornatus]|uniref:uncharacterized protein n=1 Tax=Panulirus ornatus TaxID=150431 RepID=UPI003A861C61
MACHAHDPVHRLPSWLQPVHGVMDWWLLALLVLLAGPQVVVRAMSTPPLSQVAPGGEGAGQPLITGYTQAAGRHSQSATAAGDPGFMQDIGFSQFFNDVGLQTRGSHLGVGSLTSLDPRAPITSSQSLVSGGLSGGQFGDGPFGLGFGSASTHQQQQQQRSKADQGKASDVNGFMPPNPLSSFSSYNFGVSGNPPGTGPYAIPSFGPPAHHHTSLPTFYRPSRNYERPGHPCGHPGSHHCSPQYDDGRHTPQYDDGHHTPQYDDGRHTPQYDDGHHTPQYEGGDYGPTHQEEQRRQENYFPPEQNDHSHTIQGHRYTSSEEEGQGVVDNSHCRTVRKDGMTCEVCKDEEGGSSEHCSHHRRQGEDVTYADSRQGRHHHHGPDVDPARHASQHSEARSASVYIPRSYRQQQKERQKVQKWVDEVYARPRHVEDFAKEVAYDPFPDDCRRSRCDEEHEIRPEQMVTVDQVPHAQMVTVDQVPHTDGQHAAPPSFTATVVDTPYWGLRVIVFTLGGKKGK